MLEKSANEGRVAQSGERHAYTVDVTGSSPVPPTMEERETAVSLKLEIVFLRGRS